jgi:hypothetical protein
MKRIVILTLLIFEHIIVPNLKADEKTWNTFSPGVTDSLWFITRGGSQTDEGWGTDVDSQGYIYFATFQGVPFQTDIFLYKISPDGEQIWETQWGGANSEQAFVVTVKEPYVYVGGLSFAPFSLTNTAMVVLAFNTSDGNTVWSFTWDPTQGWEEADGLVVEEDYIYVAGWTNGYSGESGQNDIALVKLTAQGDTVCTNVWGTDGWDEANGQIVVNSTTVYVAGRYNAANLIMGGDALLVAFSKEDFHYLDHRTWGGPQGDDAFGLIGDGFYLYLVGVTNSFGHTEGQIFVLKYDMNLNYLWETMWGGVKGESARAITVDIDHHILVAGKTNSSGSGLNDIALLRFNNLTGELISSEIWGGSGEEQAHGVAIAGELAYIAGETGSYGAGGQDAILIKANYCGGQFPTYIGEGSEETVMFHTFYVSQNFPNPFNPTTDIRYHIADSQSPVHTSLTIYNILGQEVITLIDKPNESGDYSVTWDGRDSVGQQVPSGVYFYKIFAGDFVGVRKMVLLR